MTDKQTQTINQLNELWELSEEGKAEWWPDDLVWSEYHDMFELHDGEGAVVVSGQHAHDLVTAEAERLLVGKGWELHRDAGGRGYEWYIYDGEVYLDKCLDSLPEALRYATNGGGT